MSKIISGIVLVAMISWLSEDFDNFVFNCLLAFAFYNAGVVYKRKLGIGD